jgi:hypothetical protein
MPLVQKMTFWYKLAQKNPPGEPGGRFLQEVI